MYNITSRCTTRKSYRPQKERFVVAMAMIIIPTGKTVANRHLSRTLETAEDEQYVPSSDTAGGPSVSSPPSLTDQQDAQLPLLLLLLLLGNPFVFYSDNTTHKRILPYIMFFKRFRIIFLCVSFTLSLALSAGSFYIMFFIVCGFFSRVYIPANFG